MTFCIPTEDDQSKGLMLPVWKNKMWWSWNKPLAIMYMSPFTPFLFVLVKIETHNEGMRQFFVFMTVCHNYSYFYADLLV